MAEPEAVAFESDMLQLQVSPLHLSECTPPRFNALLMRAGSVCEAAEWAAELAHGHRRHRGSLDVLPAADGQQPGLTGDPFTCLLITTAH